MKKKQLTKRNYKNFEKTVKFQAINYFLKKAADAPWWSAPLIDLRWMNFVFYIMSVSMIFGKILFASSPFSVFVNKQLIVSIGN